MEEFCLTMKELIEIGQKVVDALDTWACDSVVESAIEEWLKEK